MAEKIKKLTDLACRRSGPGYAGDGGGLYLQTAQGGSKSWVFRYAIAGRTREMGLGSYSTFTLAEARERARTQRQLTSDGIDPIDRRNAEREQRAQAAASRVTFGDSCEKYIAAHRSGWKNAKHAEQWDSTLRTYCAPIWKVDVAAIDTAQVLKCLEPIWHTKTETASRLRGRIERVLSWATVSKFRTGDNPAQWRGHLSEALPKRSSVQAVEHHAALPYADLATFMAALRQRDSLAARVLELQILTATRPGEAAGAQWAEFDLDGATWTLPAARMKAKREHRIPLTPAAVKLLRALPRINANVFPGVKGRAITTAASMALLKELHPGITAHGFRSTFRDWAGETTSHPREVIEHAMAHQLKDKAEAAYQRGDLLLRRAKLMKDWATYCARGK
jgi:integrase